MASPWDDQLDQLQGFTEEEKGLIHGRLLALGNDAVAMRYFHGSSARVRGALQGLLGGTSAGFGASAGTSAGTGTVNRRGEAGPSGAGGSGSDGVRLWDIISRPSPAWRTQTNSSSSHGRFYANAEFVPWDVDDSVEIATILEYLKSRLGDRTTVDDPSFTGDRLELLTSEAMTNQKFDLCVGQIVAAVATEVVGHPVRFQTNSKTAVAKGLPDFLFKLKQNGRYYEVMTGEGKTPSVMRSAGLMTDPDLDNVVRGCGEQECTYIRDREHRYGFLTYLNGTFGIRRTGKDTYAFTEVLLAGFTNLTVTQLLLYMLLKAIDEGPWVDVLEQQAGVQTNNEMEQGHDHGPPTNQQRKSPRNNKYSGPYFEGYNVYPMMALQVSDGSVGGGRSGMVALGSLNGEPAAIKMADTYQQPWLVKDLQHEASAYERLALLQGQYIPRLLGYGYWRDGASFFIATSVMVGEHPSRRTIGAMAAAEQGLSAIHRLGLLHGDICGDNILVEQEGQDYHVWFLDFGESSDVVTPTNCADEMERLQKLFRPSDDSAMSDAEVY